jgi:hypothetical protein
MAGTSYTRQSSLTDGDTITASLFNDEYNQLVNAFAYAASGTTGHQHDGGAGEGGNIEIIGDADFKNKIVVDSTNNRWSVFVEVGGTAVEQVRIEDGVVYPVTDSDVDLGTDAARFKAAYIDSITATTSLTLGTSITVSSILDEDDMASNSATALATQQSIKAYVDSQVTAQDLDVTDGTTSISIDLDSEALSVLGGTGIDSTASGNGVTLAIDSTVATLTGSQTLTNKTLTSPDVNTPDIDGGTIDGTIIGGTTAAAGSFTTVGATGNITVGGTVDGRDVAVDGTKLDTIETNADVTDTTNVTAAGALMDSEVTNLAQVKAFDSTDYATAAQGTTADAALPRTGGAMTGAITTNSTFDGRDVATDGTKLDGIEAGATADQTDAEIRAAVEAATDSNVFTDADHSKLNAIEALADVTDTANVTAAGALMDSELTSIASVKALDQGVATTDSPTFAALTSTGEITANGGIALGDNDKATFGNSDDLQIYHDGSMSYIDDAGNGDLRIRASNDISFRNYANEATAMNLSLNNGSELVQLYYAGSLRLATTSTGIDVTGTATMDGLTVQTAQGNISIPTNTSSLNFDRAGSNYIRATDVAGSFTFITGANDFATQRLNIASNGDVSLYENTGTTAKFFWDASNESLGLNNVNPSATYSVDAAKGIRVSAAAPSFTLQETDAANQTWLMASYGGSFAIRDTTVAGTAYPFQIEAATPNNTLYLDSTGNVGIGTSLPTNGKLVIEESGTSVGSTIRLIGTNTSGSTSQVSHITSYQPAGGAAEASALDFKVRGTDPYATPSTVMTLLGGGNVGIGTSSPSEKLEIAGAASATSTGIAIKNGSATRLRIFHNDNAGTNYISSHDVGAAQTLFIRSGNNLLLSGGGGTEHARITSSGNLLVGTTVSGVGVGNTSTGHNINANGALLASRTTTGDTSVAYFNRNSSDGKIAEFYKDGTTVGSIGTGGALLGIGGGTGNLGFFDATIVPMSDTSGGGSDGVINLGSVGRRFKDLYLSGGVYLGGTGAANHLDDYEEGTWTPVIRDTSAAGTIVTVSAVACTYTKIGRIVTLVGSFIRSDAASLTGSLVITGLPFTATGGQQMGGNAWVDNASGDILCQITAGNTSTMFLRAVDTPDAYVTTDDWTNLRPIYFTRTYQAS